MKTQNSFSELIDKFVLLQNNALAIIQKVNEAVISDNDAITLTLKNMNGEEEVYNFPSFGYFKEQLNRIDNTLKSLMGIGDGETIMQMPDGTYKRIITADLAKEPGDILNLSVPSNFGVKPNWFFESFLSPSMHITIDISRYIEQSAKRILCKRLIIIADTLEKQTYFDLNYKGKNDINIDELYSDLSSKGIDFYEDEEIKELPLSILQYEGTFDVIDIRDIQTTSTEGIVKTTRQYILNKLTYNNRITGINDSQTLKVGDKIIRLDTVYQITSIDASINAISLKRLSGYDTIPIGADILRVYSDIFAAKTAEVGISFNERQVIFFKSVEETNNILSKNWSPGIGIFTNELKILTTSGEQDLKSFYNDNVLDFSRSIMSIAKEKTVPSIYGEIPDPPAINTNNFKVIRINNHLFDAEEQEEIKKKGADKVQLQSEIKQLEKSIEINKQILGNTNFKTRQERNTVKNTLNSLIKEKTSKSSLYSSIVLELTSMARDHNIILEKPKYRIRGFFEIPSPKYNDNTGSQEVIQFEYAYRYLRIDEKPALAQQIEYIDANNQTKRGTFSPWVYVKSDIRKRYYDYSAGIYKWAGEDIENAELPNINSVDIPITKGEKVELKIKSYSEAGWPLNPIESDWSSSVIIEFPSDLMYNDAVDLTIQQALNEEAQVKFEETLRSKNLDLHLETSSQTGDKYIAHDASVISSGFYNNDGIVINLYEKIKLLESELKEMQNKLENKRGTIRVSILEDGSKTLKTLIKNNSTVDLFAGYYSDYIEQLSANEKKGAIITKVYKIVIENSEKAPLELMSRIPGGIAERLPETPPIGSYDPEYFDKLMYWKVPINNLSISHEETKNYGGIYAGNTQSRQLRSQFIYSRKKNIGLVTDLYKDTINSEDRIFKPNSDGNLTADWVWNGEFEWNSSALPPEGTTYPGNTKPKGGGIISDFCVHTDCPILQNRNDSPWSFNIESGTSPMIPEQFPGTNDRTWFHHFNEPIIQVGYNGFPVPGMKTSAFRHSRFFNLNSTIKDGNVQLDFKDSWPYDHNTWEVKSLDEISSEYQGIYDSENKKYFPKIYELPDKIGFYPHDRYLVGKNTCGCYLFMAPSYFDQILVDGGDYRSKRDVEFGEENAIIVPIIFQFRMVDYYGDTSTSGKVAGDISGNTKSVIYNKKLGIDIYIKDEPKFSFDINVSAKYSKKTQVEKAEISHNVTQKPSIIKTDKNNLKTL